MDKNPSIIYARLASLRISVYLLGMLVFFYILGTIFPQGGNIAEYTEAGGKWLAIVKLFNLLDIFNSWLFLFMAFLLFLNLLVCTYDRLAKIIARAEKRDGAPADLELNLKAGKTDCEWEIFGLFKNTLGFRCLRREGRIVFEKGLYYRWLTWLYHAFIILCFIGFLLSGLFLKEGYIALKPNEALYLPAPEKLGWLANNEVPSFKISLSEFSTEYIESPEIDYPQDKFSRLAIAVGWKNLSYEMKEETLLPKDWFSRLNILKHDSVVYEKTIEVNDPLKFEGWTFYQLGYEQALKLKIGGKEFRANANENVNIPTLDGTFRFGTLKAGKVYRLDGRVEELKPFVIVKKLLKTPSGKASAETIGRLGVGPEGGVSVGGKNITMTGFEESSVLSYRYDPGVGVLWVGGSLVFIVMTLRCLGRWYMVAYAIEEKQGLTRVVFSIKTKGLLASADKIKSRLERHFEELKI